MPDFWASTGYKLLRQQGRALVVSDDFLRSLFLRPEVAPVAESCDAELRLHDALMVEPRRAVAGGELLSIADPDAQANYRVLLRLRDRLLAAPTLEAAYVNLFRGDRLDVPPIFVFLLTQILLRHILGNDADPLRARMAECLFRVQKVSVLDGDGVIAADDETVERRGESGGFGSPGGPRRKQNTLSPLLDLDVLSADNAQTYWQRDQRFDLAVRLDRGEPALDALMRVLEQWVAHFLGVEITLVHRRELDHKQWGWHVGLDAVASSVLNDLYNQTPVDDARMRRLLCLFELRFSNSADMRPAIAGRPIYVAMAMDAENHLQLKPQNLLLNLPLARV
ncbi:MAG: hypothetical protein JNL19_11580 [Burkholderiales bacterium]|nr:hypothetical protein [Burkholderiales bacterium]